MASIGNDKGGLRRILFVASDGKRKTIRLGKVSLRIAEGVKWLVEHLIASKVSGVALDAETARKVAELDDVLHKKLAAVGLVEAREATTITTLASVLEDYVSRRPDVKQPTREIWRVINGNLIDYFGADRDIRAIDETGAEDFKLWLLKAGLASTTVAKRLQFVRQVFKAAARRHLIDHSPFADVTAKSSISYEQAFIPRDAIDRILEKCPNIDWRVIVCLSRYGGLRCPSEVLSLKWEYIDWERERIRVYSPKTEHHEGKAWRDIPLFPELKGVLREAFELAEDGAEYVVGGNYRLAAQKETGWANCNLRTQFNRILKRAGLEPWPRLFHALRASRETELADEWPIHKVTAWLGNTPKIAIKHYLMVTDEDFKKAAQNPAQLVPKPAQNPAQQPIAELRKIVQESKPSSNPFLGWELIWFGMGNLGIASSF